MVAFLLLGAGSSMALESVADLQRAWAHITYELVEDGRAEALERLGVEAERLVAAHPDQAEFLIWQGIILSSYAGEAGGLGALGAAKRARAALEKALELDPEALDGSAYTSLGALHYKVPGWPIGFGSDKKARSFLEKALSLNPDGIDPNYFMGEFLLQDGDAEHASQFLHKALAAPPRVGREVADAGRRAEITALLGKLQGT
jgi:tetratricopeptide (TPR) repeat protein